MSGISDSLVRHRPMPHALHIQMTARQRRKPQLRHDPRLRPRERDRVEMCLLSAQGWTAWRCIWMWCGHGPALDPAVGGPRPEVYALCAYGSSPGGDAAPAGVSRPALLSAAPAGVEFPDAVCGPGYAGSASAAAHGAQYLRLMGASYQRTKSCLRHKQDPERVAVARAELQAFKKKPAPAISSSFTWTKADSRPLCPPPIPGADPEPAPTSPTKIRRADA